MTVALSTSQAVRFSVDLHPQKLSGFLGDCGEVDEEKRLWGDWGTVERWMKGRDCGETGGLWRGG